MTTTELKTQLFILRIDPDADAPITLIEFKYALDNSLSRELYSYSKN